MLVQKAKMKRYLFWLLTSVVSVTLCLVALEAVLRISGAYLSRVNQEEITPPAVTNELRILVVGESTTAAVVAGGREKAWPGQLEKILQSRFPERKVIVLNQATPGTTSSSLIKKAEESLKAFRPDVVISMMGVNDFGVITKANGIGPLSTLSSLKIAKLYRLAKGAFYTRKNSSFYRCSVDTNLPELTEERRLTLIDQLNRHPEEGDKLFAKEIAALPSDRRASAYLYFGRAFSLGTPKLGILPKSQIALFTTFFEKSNMVEPNCHTTLQFKAYAQIIRREFSECRRDLVAAANAGIDLNSALIAALAECTSTSDTEAVEVLRRTGYEMSDSRPIEVTVSNYRKLAEWAEKNQIMMVAVQYPTKSIELIKSFFTDDPYIKSKNYFSALRDFGPAPPRNVSDRYSQVVFVENKDNFYEALKEKRFEDLFIDQFGLTFGHMTEAGHALVAQAVARRLEPLLD